MGQIYLLQHSYEIEYQGISIDRTKIIGIYSTKKKAEEVVRRYKNIEGFNKYPEDCFYIDEYEIDNDNWTEGFVSTAEIEKEFETLTLCFNEWLGIKKEAEESWKGSNYYNALCEISHKIYTAEDVQELADHIKKVWDDRFTQNSKTQDDFLAVAVKVISAIKR